MKQIIYRGQESIKLNKLLAQVMPEVSYGYLMELYRLKDIKINGKRVSQEPLVASGDTIEVFAKESKLYKFSPSVVYEDEKIVVVNKPRGISSEDYTDKINEFLHATLILAHRLDTNTEGLLIFAKTDAIFEALVIGFKANAIIKKYIAEVGGRLTREGVLKAYLVKNKDTATVTIYNKNVSGSEEIITEVKPIEVRQSSTIVEVRLHTGKTHQIRAHLAHIGYPIVGDPKYGDYKINKDMNAKKQRLTAYKLMFNFIKSSPLYYLNEKEFSVSPDFFDMDKTDTGAAIVAE